MFLATFSFPYDFPMPLILFLNIPNKMDSNPFLRSTSRGNSNKIISLVENLTDPHNVAWLCDGLLSLIPSP